MTENLAGLYFHSEELGKEYPYLFGSVGWAYAAAGANHHAVIFGDPKTGETKWSKDTPINVIPNTCMECWDFYRDEETIGKVIASIKAHKDAIGPSGSI